MRFQKFKSDSYCVGARHRSATKKSYGDITSKVSKILIGYCSICNRKKSMTVSDNTIQAECLGNFLKSLAKSFVRVGKKLAKNVILNPEPAFDIKANIATAATSRNLEIVISTPRELINFHNTGKRLYLGNFL